MDGPTDLEKRLAAVQEQIKSLHGLNQRFGTNFVNLSVAVRHGKQHGLIDKAEHDQLMQTNQRANEAKHHDLGSTLGARGDTREETLDSADLGIVAVLEASHPNYLPLREVYLLGLARDPDKEQMGAGVKKELNQRLYKLQKKGFIVTDKGGRWLFKSKIPECSVHKSSTMMPPQGSVLPVGFGCPDLPDLLTSGVQNLKISSSRSPILEMTKTPPPSAAPMSPAAARSVESHMTKDAVLHAMAGTADPLAVDEVALLCLGVADPKQAKKDLSKLLIALRDEGAVSCESGRWISRA